MDFDRKLIMDLETKPLRYYYCFDFGNKFKRIWKPNPYDIIAVLILAINLKGFGNQTPTLK